MAMKANDRFIACRIKDIYRTYPNKDCSIDFCFDALQFEKCSLEESDTTVYHFEILV
jgi:hypothetical protein